MLSMIKRWLARYDAWCARWGLLPEHQRCCVPRRSEAQADQTPKNRD